MRSIKRLAAQPLFEFAVKSLGRKAQSTAELRARLASRAEDAGDVEPVLVRLREYGYLDDKRFAESFALSRLENDGFGRSRTLNDLRMRRVAPPTAAAAVDTTYSTTDETALIERYIRRKYRTANRATLFERDQDLAAAYRRLLRAGFRSGAVVKVLKRFAKNPELLDTVEEPAEGE